MDNEAFKEENEMVTRFSSDPEPMIANEVNLPPPDYETVEVEVIKPTENSISTDPDKFALEVYESHTDAAEVAEVADKPYADMGKEDLLRFSETIYWKRFRLISILLFWACWLALLAAVIALTIVAPRCDAQPTPIWWQKSVVYQIYVRSFYDRNGGDGVGDIPGVTAKLPYLKDLNVDAILLSSVLDSEHAPFSDYGYEITNFTQIDPTYGTLGDFLTLLEVAHNHSIKVLMDFVPNYTGLQHPWFVWSSQSNDYSNQYRNYYVWTECASQLPNNWLSVYGESAWERGTARTDECYLHQFLKNQPELNLRNRAVQQNLEEVLQYWLNHGIDGFRVVNTAYLFEDVDLTNDTEHTPCNNTDNQYECFDHEHTRLLPESYDIVARWRAVVDQYNLDDPNPNNTRVLLTDADVEVSQAVRYYGTEYGLNGANVAINYGLTHLTNSSAGSELSQIVRDWIEQSPSGATANWLTGDQDRPRLASYLDAHTVNAVMLVRMTLPGVAFIYYGEEIGMTSSNITDGRHDPAGNISLALSRDGHRTPMQWNGTSDGGFIDKTNTGTNPWLPVGDTTVNVEDQVDVSNSTLEFVRSLIQLRQDQGSLQYGAIHFLYNSSNVFSYVREHEGNDRILVIVNMGSSLVNPVDLTTDQYSIGVPEEAEIVMVTDNSMEWELGDTVNLRSITLEWGQGFVAKWSYQRPTA